MIGFITTKEEADAINQAIADAQIARGYPVFWQAGSYEIFTGEHTGSYFVPCDDQTLNTPLIGNPPTAPQSSEEFAQIIALAGGLESRVDLDPAAIVNPMSFGLKKSTP